MRLALVGSAGASPARLEELLLMLLERRGVDVILPVGAAQGEVQAVVRGRERRYPVEVAWNAPEYADFVLAAVLEGHGAQPAQLEEQARNQRLQRVIRRPGKGSVHLEEVGGRVIAFVQDEAQAPANATLVVVPMPGPALDRPASGVPRARLRPGGLAPDGRLVAVELEATSGGLDVRFVDATGEILRTERL